MLWLKLVFFSLLGVSLALDLDGCKGEPKIINALKDGLEGDIYSPGYKEGVSYPDEIHCLYILRAPYGFKIRLHFEDFDLQALDMCAADYLLVNEKGIGTHGIFCGNSTVADIVTIGSVIHLEFRSDFMQSGRGFHLKYKTSVSLKLCGANQQPCYNRNCFNVTSTCDGKDDCGDGTDEEGCGLPIPTTTCGKRMWEDVPDFSADRVVGGKEAIPGSWPWQADLQLAIMHPNGHMCGGTLINSQWVLSASHCFLNTMEMQWRVHFGNHRKFKKDYYEQVRYVEKVVIYPDISLEYGFGEENLDIVNDMALMKLNAPVIFNDRVRPACLPEQNFEIEIGTTCMATGWGATRGTGSNDVLKEIDLTIKDHEKCKNDQAPMNKTTMICVKHENEKHDVCHGDSGGPLVCRINDNWTVVGATSYGTQISLESGLCGLPNSFTVYSKVSNKIGWIQKTINKYS